MAQPFGDYLRARHIRLADLARDAGLKNITMLSAWQRGMVLLPHRTKVLVVAHVLGIEPDTLFEMIEESYRQAQAKNKDPALAA